MLHTQISFDFQAYREHIVLR